MNSRFFVFSLAAIAAAASAPSLADVKTGVDAWTAGDYASAIKQWEGPAARGDADAQFNLAQAYKWGRGVKQDLKKAELLYGKAAALGHMRASDEYGLLMFDRGERAMALPYVQTAANRGDPRAQYLLSIAHFNGDLVAKDWVRAYALMSLARTAGLPQASSGLQQMDGFIPLTQRQQAVALSQQISADTEATRNRQLASSDLGVSAPPPSAVRPAAPVRPVVTPVRPPQVAVNQPSIETAVAAAERVAAGSTPNTAGADYARPAAKTPPPAPRQVAVAVAPPAAVKSPVSAAPRSAVAAAPSGAWRLQFGAFGVAANADALWAKLKSRPEVAGHPRVNVAVGAVTKLQAGGYSEEAARAACSKLAAAGFACVAVKN